MEVCGQKSTLSATIIIDIQLRQCDFQNIVLWFPYVNFFLYFKRDVKCTLKHTIPICIVQCTEFRN